LRAKRYGAVDVGTVEDYQGMERKIILLSCVRSRKRFLQDDVKNNLGLIFAPARLNVAMTRAMRCVGKSFITFHLH
jgi:superfamily I DNA and/or RNA helicase